MSYFDLHMHPVFKRFICDFETVYPTEREQQEVLQPIRLKNPVINIADEKIFHILRSQCCFNQLQTGTVEFGVAAIAPVERFFSEKRGVFGFLLNSSFFTSPLDQAYMDKIRDGKISYYQLFLKEFSLYRKLQDAGVITFLKRYEPDSMNGGGIRMALALEGGHGLCRTRIGVPSEEDQIIGWDGTKPDVLMQDFKDFPVLSAAESLKHLQQCLWNTQADLFYLTLTHLSNITEQPLCTHAYGIKMLKGNLGFPNGNGLRIEGKKVIDAAYTLEVENSGTKVHAPVLIDIKHMGLKSRMDFYTYRKEMGYTLPILATHMGVTGYSFNDWKAAIEDYNRIKKDNLHISISIKEKYIGTWGALKEPFTFNPWSINLLDEDITEIINSKGLIGVSLDVRILGWDKAIKLNKEADEIISKEDFRCFFPDKYAALPIDEQLPPGTESYIVPGVQERHPLSLCFNIIHILSVGKRTTTGIDVWNHICIGSDLDGLVDPVVNCNTAASFPELEQKLVQWLPVAETIYLNNNGGFPVLPKDTNGNIDNVQFQQKVRNFCYNNGKEFFQKWITNNL